MSYILITGGAGYIGTHVCVELYKITTNILVLDNYSNSYKTIISKMNKYTPKIQFLEGDLLDIHILDRIFSKYPIRHVIHLSAFKSSPESIKNPIAYYNNNIVSTINLLNIMKTYKCYNLIFSSSAAVYGSHCSSPLYETDTPSPDTPYARSKHFIEQILKDIQYSYDKWNIIILRYFNPVGSHSDYSLVDCPVQKVDGLFNNIYSVLLKKTNQLTIYASNSTTKDGSCIRDFIHICDLANAHIKSIDYLNNNKNCYQIFNIGTGNGYSVLEVVKKFNIPYIISPPRKGDVSISYADATKANKILQWESTYNLDDIVQNCIDELLKRSSIPTI